MKQNLVALALLSVCVYSWGVVQNGGVYRIYVRQMIPGGKLCGMQKNVKSGGAPGVKDHERVAKVDCHPDHEGHLYRVEKAGDGGWLITDTYHNCGIDWVKEAGLNVPLIKPYEHLAKMDCKYGSLPINIHDDGLDHIKVSRRINDKQCGLQMNSKTGGLPGVADFERVLKFDCKKAGDDVSFDLQLDDGGVYKVFTYHDGKRCGLVMNERRGQATGVKPHERLAKFDCNHPDRATRLEAHPTTDGVHFTLEGQFRRCGLQMAAPTSGESNAGIGKHETVAKFDCNGKRDPILIENGGIYVHARDGSYCALQGHHGEGASPAPGVRKGEIVAKFDCSARADRMVFKKVGESHRHHDHLHYGEHDHHHEHGHHLNVISRLIEAMLK